MRQPDSSFDTLANQYLFAGSQGIRHEKDGECTMRVNFHYMDKYPHYCTAANGYSSAT